jgi:two-component system, NtrC family, sensor kinase
MQEIRTLIVEDSRLDARILEGLMKKSNLFEFHSHLVMSGNDAMQFTKDNPTDLVMLDLGLPESAGADTIARMSEFIHCIPTIVFTGDDDMELALTALRHGAQDYLVKGHFDLAILDKSVRHALERHRMHMERVKTEMSLKEAVDRSNRMLKALDKTNAQLKKEIARSRLLTTAIEQSVETVVITDIEGTIAYANKSFEMVTGYTVDEALGQTPRMLKSGLHDERFYRELWQTLIQTGTWFGRLKNRKKDGTIFEEEARISVVKDEAGNVTNYVAVKKDITHEAALEMQLMQARKLESIGQLAAGIAHEINTPSQYVGDNIRFLQEAIDGFVAVIAKYDELRKEIDPQLKSGELYTQLQQTKEDFDLEFLLEEAPTAINQSLEGIERISKIVAAMKEFAHPGTGQMTMNDINRALNSTITVASNEWKYVAHVETDLREGLPMVPCYIGEMNQVFLNILVNAAHAIGSANRESGKIRVSTALEEPFVRIDISDNGTGIPEAIQQRIFDPFFTTKEVGKGTGQGLAMAFTTVTERHHGKLQVNSEVGEGTTFSLFLPLTQNEEAADAG